MIKVFLENSWDEIISQRGLQLLEKKGIALFGNLLSGKRRVALSSLSEMDFFIITDPKMKLVNYARKQGRPVVFYALFPDQILGWNCEKNCYGNAFKKEFATYIGYCQDLLVNSLFTKRLLEKEAQKLELPAIKLIYPGVDIKLITQAPPLLSKSRRIRVLWNHMWRVDKGFVQALEIIYNLAKRFPEVEFYIGRKENWGSKKLSYLKASYQKFKKKKEQKKLKNIRIQNRISNQKKYWSFLKSMDISFSCSLHESFGTSMLEQEAAGMACIVPNSEVYPEVHLGALKVPYSQIQEELTKLIMNSKKRKKVALKCQENAKNFRVENFVNIFSNYINLTEKRLNRN